MHARGHVHMCMRMRGCVFTTLGARSRGLTCATKKNSSESVPSLTKRSR